MVHTVLGMMRRGIDVVRGKIKMFAQKRVTLPKGRHKIVILDEADRYCSLRMRYREYIDDRRSMVNRVV